MTNANNEVMQMLASTKNPRIRKDNVSFLYGRAIQRKIKKLRGELEISLSVIGKDLQEELIDAIPSANEDTQFEIIECLYYLMSSR